jgi:hypothetical protein
VEVLVIGSLFSGVVGGDAVLTATLIVRALRADQRYLNEFEEPTPGRTSEPAWVRPHAAAARQPAV